MSTLKTPNGEEEIVQLKSWALVNNGVLRLDFQDGDAELYAPGQWLYLYINED